MAELFDICVIILYWISDLTGLTYKEVTSGYLSLYTHS